MRAPGRQVPMAINVMAMSCSVTPALHANRLPKSMISAHRPNSNEMAASSAGHAPRYTTRA